MSSQKGFTLVEGLLIALVLSVIGFSGYYIWNQQQSDDGSIDSVQKSTEVETANQASTSDSLAKADVVIVKNETLNCEFGYPEAWGEATATDAESTVQGTYTVYKFSNSDYTFNLYCDTVSNFAYKDFGGSVTKIIDGEFVNDNFGDITSIEKYKEVNDIQWYKTGRGDAGNVEYSYLASNEDKVVAISFIGSDTGSEVVDYIQL